MIRCAAGTLMALLTCWQCASGQDASRRLEFEAASVKPAPAWNGEDYQKRGGPGTDDPGRVTYPRTWLPSLVAEAYGVRGDQVASPEWMKTEAYSIMAKVSPNSTKEQFNPMLRALLAERFHLALHHEAKDFPVYILSVAPGGAKLLAEAPAATTPPAEAPSTGREKSRFPAPPARGGQAAAYSEGMVYLTCRRTMAEFAERLGASVSMSNGDGVLRGGPPTPRVIDETGLAGTFDFTLEFAGALTPSPSLAAAASAQDGQTALAADPSGNGPNLFSALENQLGLRLQKGKRAVDMLVIDHADRIPTEN